jgi:hypothetical protein
MALKLPDVQVVLSRGTVALAWKTAGLQGANASGRQGEVQ